MMDPQRDQNGGSQEDRSRQSNAAGESGSVASPFQAPDGSEGGSANTTARGTAVVSAHTQLSRDASVDLQSQDMLDLDDIFNTIPSGMNIDTEQINQASRQASVASTSILPVRSGAPILNSSHSQSSQPVSGSSSSSHSLPTPSQLLKGKHKEGSIPLSPFGHNDNNNSRADRDDSNQSTSALRAFSRPEAADTQISATTSDFHATSSLPSQLPSWPLMDEDMTSNLGGFSLPSEGLFPSDGSDMADLFGPGSNALFEQLRAAMRVSPEAPPWEPPAKEIPPPQLLEEAAEKPPEAPKEDDSDDSDDDDDADLAFNFDLDAQINAAMASLTSETKSASPSTSQLPAPSGTTAPKAPERASSADAVPAPEPRQPTPALPQEPQPPQAAEAEAEIAQPSVQDAPKELHEKTVGSDSDEDDDDDDDADATIAAQFDLDAMLASAMGDAVGAAVKEDESMEASPAPAAEATGEAQAQSRVPAEESDSDQSDEDEDAEPAFDLDAHLRQAMAMAREQASLSPGEEVIDVGTPLGSATSDESSDNDEAGFDLDAQIGAALANQIMASVQQQQQNQQQQTPRQETQKRPEPKIKEPSPDFLAHDLQNMLQAAMKQAAQELELEQQEQTTQLEGMSIAAKEQEQAFPGQQPVQAAPFVPRRFAMPPKPRTRPRVEDDGDPENAYNKSRQAHPQALHTAYKCDFKGCDKVFAKLQTFQTHRQTHQGVKPYKCHLCPAMFTTNQEFQDHSWTHNRTREWKYRCKGCFNLFGDKSLFDQHVTKARDIRCSRGECELQMRPAGARVTMPPVHPSHVNGNLNKANHDNYFVKSGFDQSALLAATLVHQMSSLLARQYDRQTSLLGPNDPRIDVNLALRQTFQRAGLTPNETAALATILATVGHARNEGLKASLEEARKAQFETYRSHQERQRRNAIKLIKRERRRLKQEADKATAQAKKKADQAAQAEKRKQAEREQNGDIPVPQAVM